MAWINVDVDIDDIWDGMSLGDKRVMSEWLHDDGILQSHPNPEIQRIVIGDDESFDEREFKNSLSKLSRKYYQLSNDEIEKINLMAKNL
jgi:hypothetical protein